MFGPRELYDSSPKPFQQTAATANALGDDAGSSRLPAAVWNWIGPVPRTNRSSRGAVAAENCEITAENVSVAPVFVKHRSSVGDRVNPA